MLRGVALAALLVLPSAGARAQNVTVVAGPGAFTTTYTTPYVVSPAGAPITLLNADVGNHAMESTEQKGPDANPWCGTLDGEPESPTNPRRYARGKCPLLWSEAATPNGGRRPLLGVEQMVPGRAYAFFCRIFPEMNGLIIAT